MEATVTENETGVDSDVGTHNWYNQPSIVDNATISHFRIQEDRVSIDINKRARSDYNNNIDIVFSSL